ncbi:hypothetical protein ACFOUP_03705 [Belliella kenyensis]|uniref:Lipoprotein n=1 Tax=Belliella kenyensis TaxID=1472724 RepID=A0ABV8EJR6_9BACT|nr:hypothetical protein [Belliella kenyensis]MCH7403709.1 hypothetical protein [Belliella kenyensis]MDN3603476.1 hypothetical protein [Belliella kenyensis]
MSIVIKFFSYLFLISLLISCGKAAKNDSETEFTVSTEDTIQVHKFIDHIFLPIIERDTIVFLVEEAVFDWSVRVRELSVAKLQNLNQFNELQQNTGRYFREKSKSVLDVFSGEDEFQKVWKMSSDKFTFQKTDLPSGLLLLEKEYVLHAPLAQMDSLKEGSINTLKYYEISKPVFFGEADRFCFLYWSNAFYSAGIGSGGSSIVIYERDNEGWNEVVIIPLFMY